mmetsp:Transcript_61570/g.178589  ORF Transcript_61570/g.178589 Transcript_61570/m.178589 type:complete len:341 (-) Transcript_61570:1702-2724(-)
MSSKTLRWFAAGNSTWRTPARSAAKTLSRIPPTSNTCPRSVTSPVTAVSLLIGLPSSTEAKAKTTATPAEGPSLGIPPAGKCTWTSSSLKGSRPAPSPLGAPAPNDLECKDLHTSSVSRGWPLRTKRLLNKDNAVCTLSLITEPSWPVTMSRPLPRKRVASTNKSWPPTVDTDKPMATPTLSRSAMSRSKCSGPRMCGKWWESTVMRPSASGAQLASAASCSVDSALPLVPDAMATFCSRSAAQRQICANCRSKERTPLSEVQLVMSARIASRVKTNFGGSSALAVSLAASPLPSPSTPSTSISSSPRSERSAGPFSKAWRRRCFGNKWESAMATFSSTV